MQRLLLRYTQALLTQMCQTAACNRHHSIDQQLCRSLLLTLDRLPSDELVMTQELVASALGVRRESVTEAAGKLQRAGFVRYRRGHISVLDRAGLETGACECYAVVKKEIRRLLSDVRYRQNERRLHSWMHRALALRSKAGTDGPLSSPRIARIVDASDRRAVSTIGDQ